MNAIVDDPALARLTLHAPAPAQTPSARPSTSDRRPVHLDRRDTLRIVDGAGLRLRACSGVVWITEEHSSRDTVLLPGDTHDIGNEGLTLALAHRTARILVERPVGVPPPRRAEVVTAGGKRVHRVALGAPRRFPLRSRIAAMVRAMRRHLAPVATETRDVSFPYY